MNRLTKVQEKERAELVDRLRAWVSEIEQTLQVANEAIRMANESIEGYNAVLAEAREWRDDRVSELDDYISGKSEKWQESERGSAFSDWKDRIENLDLEDLDEIEEIEAPDFDHAETLEDSDLSEPSQ